MFALCTNGVSIMFTYNFLRYLTVFKLLYFMLILPNIIAAPLPPNMTLYDASVQNLIVNKCKMPKEINLPFPKTSDPSTFDYFKVPLNECRTAEAMHENKESNLLCKEIFEVLRNITCSKYNTLPEIKNNRLSNDVCGQFKAIKDILPKQNEYLAGRLVDPIVCGLLCQDKFETLCQTLLWSYDVQYQIKNSLKTKDAEDKDNKIVKTVKNKGTTVTQKTTQKPVLDEVHDPNKGKQLIAENQAGNVDINDQTESANESNTNNFESTPQGVNSSDNPMTSKELNTATVNKNSNNNDKTSKVMISASNENLQENEVAGSDLQVPTKQQKDLLVNKQIETNKKVESDNAEVIQVTAEQNEALSNDLAGKVKITDVSKNSAARIVTENKLGKEVSSNTLQDQDKNKANNNNIENFPVTEISTVSNLEENELKNVDLGEENESKVQGKLSDSEIPAADNTNKLTDIPKEADSAIPNKIASDMESSTLQISPDINANAEQDEEQDEKDSEQYYNDTENNEGDYPKSEYENTLNEISKAKKPEIKSSVVSEVANSNEFPSNYDVFMNRNNIGRGSDQMQVVSTFPEQEDSHFFFYFLSIVLILMAGYLIFHNKQKIIALIVEGRHERRRRSHGAGYKKLETK